MIPAWLLPRTVTVTTPALVTDAYGAQVPDYTAGTTRQVGGYLQPQPGDEATTDRDAVTRAWLLFSNEPVAATDRVTHEGRTYEVDGPSRGWDTPTGTHHHETNLTLVEG